jgi:hypothetical protein
VLTYHKFPQQAWRVEEFQPYRVTLAGGETLASLLREHLARTEDARTLLRQIFDTEADLLPDLTNKTLTVRRHHLTHAAHDQAIQPLLAELNPTQAIFPGTNFALVFKIGSS